MAAPLKVLAPTAIPQLCIDTPAQHMTTATPPAHFFIRLLWFFILAVFFALRIDTSPRTYFQIDDQIVVWAVDDAVNNGNWQPDWYRLGAQAAQQKGIAHTEIRDEPAREHHYNFSGHMLLSAAIIKPLRLLGITTPTIVLLHHIAVFWDAISLLFIVLVARTVGRTTANLEILALCSAMIYTVLPLAVQGSHYARPDALLTAMGSVLLWLTFKKDTWKNSTWLLANGAVLGIATAGKASQLMLGIFPALACCTPLLHTANRDTKTLLQIALQGLALLAIVLAVLQLMFFCGDMSARDFWLSVRSVQLYYQNPQPPELLARYSFFIQLKNIAAYFYATLGWPLLAISVIGAITLAAQKQIKTLLLLTVPLTLFTLYFASIPAFFDRSFCGLAATMTLLPALGITAITQRAPAKLLLTILLTLLICWRPIAIQYPLQTNLLRSYHNDKRLIFQQQLKQQWSDKNRKTYWIKNIDRRDLFSQTLPEALTGNPRIFMVEDLNDNNSRLYLQKMRDNGYVQIAEYEGAFTNMPTNSLIVVHEAARFYYFVRTQDLH